MKTPRQLDLTRGTVDFGNQVLRCPDGQIPLSTRECAVLAALAARLGNTVRRDELAQTLARLGLLGDRVVDHAIRRLRRKLEVDHTHPEHLLTVHGEGYRLVPRRDDQIVAPSSAPARRLLSLGDHVVDLDLGTVSGPSSECTLTTREREMLMYLADRLGSPVPQSELLARVWGYRSRTRTRALHATLYRLRKKLEDDPDNPRFLRTVRGRGVALCRADIALGGTSAVAALALSTTDLLRRAVPTEQSALIAQFEEIHRAQLEPWHGREAETTGANVLAIFPHVSDALGWVTSVRRALMEVEVESAGAVDLGELHSRLDPVSQQEQWLGESIANVRTMLAACTSGQLLLTRRAAAATTELPAPLQAQGVLPTITPEPLPVLEVRDGWSTGGRLVGSIRTHPAHGDPTFGLGTERRRLAERLERHRVVAIRGPGGVGKTRLASVFASEWRSGPVCFCPLQPGASDQAVLSAVASELGLALAQVAEGTARRLGAALSRCGALLLVLDDLERPSDSLRAIVGSWLERAPRLRVLATARTAPHLPGERSVHVGPLSGDDAAALFVDRCEAQGIDIADAHRPLTEAIVEQIGRIPLAIELAASRVGVLGVVGVHAHLVEPLDLLVDPTRTDRHGAIRWTLEASWEALPPWVQTACAQCAAFCGLFTIELATRVVELGPGSPPVIDALHILRDHSLLTSTLPLQMHRLVREFAAERLAARPDATEVLLRHAQAVVARTETLLRGATDPDTAAATTERAQFEADLRAIATRMAGNHPDLSIRAVLALNADLDALETALERAGSLSPSVAFMACTRRVDHLRRLGRGRDADKALDEAEALAAELGPSAQATYQARRGSRLLIQGRSEAASSLLRGALQLAEAHGDADIVAETRNLLAREAWSRGAPQQALEHLRAAELAMQRHGSVSSLCLLRGNIAIVLGDLGDLEAGCAEVGQALERLRGHQAPYIRGILLGHLGTLQLARDELEEAERCIREAIRFKSMVGSARNEHIALALVQVLRGELEPALSSIRSGMPSLEAVGDERTIVQAHLIRAMALGMCGDSEAADRAVQQAERCDLEGNALTRAWFELVHHLVRVTRLDPGPAGDVARASATEFLARPKPLSAMLHRLHGLLADVMVTSRHTPCSCRSRRCLEGPCCLVRGA